MKDSIPYSVLLPQIFPNRTNNAHPGGFDICAIQYSHRYEFYEPIINHPDRIYDIGCAQKVLSGAILFSLMQEGVIDPYLPVGEYIPELNSGNGAIGRNVRVVDLLCHASGYLHLQGEFTNGADLCAVLTNIYPAFAPGEIVDVGNTDYLLLLYLVMRVTGRSIYEEIEHRVFRLNGLQLRKRGSSMHEEWYEMQMRPEEMLVALNTVLDPKGNWGAAFQKVLRENQVPTSKSAAAISTKFPSTFSWGLGRFDNGLWGGGGQPTGHALGLRFDFEGQLMAAGVVEGLQIRANMIFERLTEAFGFQASHVAAQSVIGAVTELSPDRIGGHYRSSHGRHAEVVVEADEVKCRVVRDDIVGHRFYGKIGADGLIKGRSWFPEARLEFFPRQSDGAPIMRAGSFTFTQEEI